MSVSLTLTVATLLLMGRGGSGIHLSESSRLLVEVKESCLQQCMQKYSSQSVQNWFSSSTCCDRKAFCDIFCTMQVNTRSPGLMSLKFLKTVGDKTSSSANPAELNFGSQLNVPDILWRNALASCRNCRRKRKLRSPMLREAALIARSVGMDLGDIDTAGTKSPLSGEHSDSVKVLKVKNMRLLSLSPNEGSIRAQIVWDYWPLQASSPWFLVTWETEGGSLRGNLLTNNTSTSLSLIPDNVYHLQISSGTDDSSGCLIVDTHPPSPTQLPHTFSRSEGAAGVAGAILIFFLIILFLSRRWCYTPISPGNKSGLVYGDFDHFRVFPPPVTIQMTSSPQLQSQTLESQPPPLM